MSYSSGSYSPYSPPYPYRDREKRIEWYPAPQEAHIPSPRKHYNAYTDVERSPIYYSPPDSPNSVRSRGRYNGWITPNADWIGDTFSAFEQNRKPFERNQSFDRSRPVFEKARQTRDYDDRIVPYSERVADRFALSSVSDRQVQPYREEDDRQLVQFSNAARSRMDNMKEAFDTLRSKVTDFGDRFLLKLDVGEFDVEDIEVTSHGSQIIIRGAHYDRAEGPDEVVSRRFVREFYMPEPVWSPGVTSRIRGDGILEVDVPKR